MKVRKINEEDILEFQLREVRREKGEEKMRRKGNAKKADDENWKEKLEGKSSLEKAARHYACKLS